MNEEFSVVSQFQLMSWWFLWIYLVVYLWTAAPTFHF